MDPKSKIRAGQPWAWPGDPVGPRQRWSRGLDRRVEPGDDNQ